MTRFSIHVGNFRKSAGLVAQLAGLIAFLSGPIKLVFYRQKVAMYAIRKIFNLVAQL